LHTVISVSYLDVSWDILAFIDINSSSEQNCHISVTISK